MQHGTWPSTDPQHKMDTSSSLSVPPVRLVEVGDGGEAFEGVDGGESGEVGEARDGVVDVEGGEAM